MSNEYPSDEYIYKNAPSYGMGPSERVREATRMLNSIGLDAEVGGNDEFVRVFVDKSADYRGWQVMRVTGEAHRLKDIEQVSSQEYHLR